MDVAATKPDASPEYNLSLSSEKAIVLIGRECSLRRCVGAAGGGIDMVNEDQQNRR